MKKKAASNFVYALALIFSVLLTAEFLCRFWLPEYRRDFLEIRPSGLRANKPGYAAKVYSDRTPIGWNYVFTDDKGFRIARPNTTSLTKNETKEEDSFRIVIYGDSLSFGMHVEYEEAFPYLLEKRLQDRFPEMPIEVLNCSIISANISELLGAMENDCKIEDIDLAILQTTIYHDFGTFALLSGDVAGRDQQLAFFLHQCFPKMDLGPLISYDEFGTLRLKNVDQLYQKYAGYFGSWLPLYEHSHFVRKIEHNLMSQIKFPCRQRKFPFLFDSTALKVLRSIEKKYSLENKNIPHAETSHRIVKHWRDKFQSSGVNFLVINLPNAQGMSIHPDRLDQPHRQIVSDYLHQRHRDDLEIYQKEYLLYLKELKDSQVQSVDFLEIFSQYDIHEIYLPGDNHLNFRGHQVVMEHLLKYIL